ETRGRRIGPARVLVRMKMALGAVVDPEDMRVHHLGIEDVVAISRQAAHALVQRGAAQVLG
ncbi:MAG TPA: hypothetical protein VHH36_06935, partial [Candidatus Thermoplasmatota archaeon]|nr:hypothetical protein [Candidatus Thermoplasmatota archaeon]